MVTVRRREPVRLTDTDMFQDWLKRQGVPWPKERWNQDRIVAAFKLADPGEGCKADSDKRL